MPFMPEGVIHPSSPCAECGRVMVRRNESRDESGTRWPGTVVFHGNGVCGGCVSALVRRSHVDVRRDVSIAKLYRGPAVPFEETERGYLAWVDRRNQRIERTARRQAVQR